MSERDEQAAALLVQKDLLSRSGNKLNELNTILNTLKEKQESSDNQLDHALAELDMIIDEQWCDKWEDSGSDIALGFEHEEEQSEVSSVVAPVTLLDTFDFNAEMSWFQYQQSVERYAIHNNIDLDVDPFRTLMSPLQRTELEKRIRNEFTVRNAQCDRYDYLIAVTCGIIGGIIDACFVGLPGKGKLTQFSDSAVNSAVEKFASVCGWKGAKEGSDPTKSAIGFLEGKFKINYDQATTSGKNGTGGAVNNLSLKNHHLKSLGHSPDLCGLFFSILNQFTSTSTFVSNGRIITIETENFELKGGNFIAKLYCGFANWLGHLFSDMAGSSGASGRGAGIPIPFYNLLLLLDVGESGQHKQSFATIATQVFEKGYDFRHGIALAIPVLITELLTRLMWTCKQWLYHKKPLTECVPVENDPELRRMLLIAHGTLCMIDAGDAAFRSGGNLMTFLLRTNMVGWVRFGMLALKEVHGLYNTGHIDVDSVDKYLDTELERLSSHLY